MLIPSIDLANGRAVQLRQGKELALQRDDVFELFEQFSLLGEVALIDLDAAMGRGDNRKLIAELLRHGPARVGGGIRDEQTARFFLRSGASRIILGTAMREDWVAPLPRARLIFALDARGDHLQSHGWQTSSPTDPRALLEPLSSRCSEFLYTQVEKEGMLGGLDRPRIEAMVASSPLPLTVAGGITTLEDIAWLRSLGASAQIGMALYGGAFSLAEAFLAGLRWPENGLIPTIVQDARDASVRMLAYSSLDSLRQAFASRKGVYFSRSRGKLWSKGEESGHTQRLLRVQADCDGDALLFTVEQRGPTCHLKRPSCFPREGHHFGLPALSHVLEQRQQAAPAGSFTARLLADADLLHAKLREECEELIAAVGLEELRWEAADLIYFALVAARAGGVSLREIENELGSRHGNPRQ